jgi:anti-sigma regulatory factor (Ser/Thr protein kinase)
MKRDRRSKRITLRIGNQIAELRKVVEAVNKFGADHGLPMIVLSEMNVALDEILNNIITYGFVDDKHHEIVISLCLAQDALTAEVQDDGIAFNPIEALPPDLSGGLFERRVGGLGIHLIRSLMDNMEYDRKGGLNQLRLRRCLGRRE